MIGINLVFYLQFLALQLSPVPVLTFIVLYAWAGWSAGRAAACAVATYAGAYLAAGGGEYLWALL